MSYTIMVVMSAMTAPPPSNHETIQITKARQGEPLESEQLESEPLESEPLESEPLESELLESEPLESEPLESGVQEALYVWQ